MSTVPRYGFLARPKWLAFSALVLALVVAMVNLALWQLRRLDARRDRNAQVTERTAEAPAPVGSLITPTSPPGTVDAVEWRPVSATGTYDPAREVLIRNRSLDGRAGYHVVTPLVLDDGSALLVNRGWVPLETEIGDAPVVASAPTAKVTIVGRLRPTQQRGRFFSPSDPPDGTLSQLYRVDVRRIAQQVPYPLVPAYVELLTTQPAPGAPQPALLPLPELGDGPHLGYAGQWVLFSCCAIAGWIVIVRRAAKRQPGAAKKEDADAAAATEPVSG